VDPTLGAIRRPGLGLSGFEDLGRGALPGSDRAVDRAAMNVDDRTELLGGMQQGAPAEVFAQVVGIVRSTLTPCDAEVLAPRLGIA